MLDLLGVQDTCSDVIDTRVVLESSSESSFLLTEFGNELSVILRPNTLLEDGFNHLDVTLDKVELKDSGLPLTVFLSVVLHEFEANGSHLL